MVTRTFSKTWAMAGARLGYLVADPAVVAACESVVLPYHLSAQTQIGRPASPCGTCPRWRPGWRASPRSGGGWRPPWATCRSTAGPRTPTSSSSGPADRDATEVWRGLLDHSVLIRNCASWDGLRGCLRVTIGTADENDRFLHALKESL